MTRIIMTSGISWHVVDAKWEGICQAFANFDVAKVAGMTAADIDRLATDERIIRNRRKIEATINNAGMIAAIEKRYGGFDRYLGSFETYEQKVAALKRDFSFIGDSTAYFFLAMVGERVPDWDQHAHRMAERRTPTKANR